MLPRLIATDLDGTLLRDDGTVAARTRAALADARQAGIDVVVCTARPARWIDGLVRDAGIAGPAVCANGAVLYDAAARAVLQEFPIPAATALEVVQRLRAVIPAAAWAIECADRFAHEPSYITRWPVGDDTVIDHVDALLTSMAPVKLLLRETVSGDDGLRGQELAPAGAADALVTRARSEVGELVEVTHSSSLDLLLEMSATGVSKGSGLAALCAARGIDAAEVIAFGDMPNDLPMLTWAGRGVAMGNAHPDVLAAADAVTDSNERDGVAAVLEQLLG